MPSQPGRSEVGHFASVNHVVVTCPVVDDPTMMRMNYSFFDFCELFLVTVTVSKFLRNIKPMRVPLFVGNAPV